MKQHWLLQALFQSGGPTLFLALICITVGALFWGDAEPLAVTFLISGIGALALFVLLAWQQHKQRA
ncbi:conserved hypothetical protein [Gammaproteobacteria bacterium]